MSLLEVKDLYKTFPVGAGGLFRREDKKVHAVDGVSFTLDEGEVLAVVGEVGVWQIDPGFDAYELRDAERWAGFFQR